jgi:autotransporter-associated beta strand protein
VTNNGALVFNRSDAVSFNGDIDGSGSLTKSGAGTLTLTGTNTYSGATTVSGGTLAMNGSLTNSAVTVNSGGTLGGSGNISGAMMVNSGGTLAPGNSPGLLTVGSLTLDADSLLNFELGDPAGVAGTDSDLVAVTGNLTLAGKLQVTPLTGFGAGSYRLFNYGGTLTDNGATFDTMPVAYDYSLNTATANQVNLAVTAATAQYWNGANVTPQHVAQGSGGSGAWDGATTNWTNAAGNGSGAHPIAPNLPAIFAGTAGTVTIANGFIASTPALSFLTDGYLLDADGTGALELTGAATVEVLPSNVSTTIAAPITGTAGLAKSGAGTLTLTGANSYTGGTTVTAGTLQVGAGGTAGSLTGNVTNNGALVFNRSDAASFNGDIDGTGSLTQSGAGTLTLTGANSYTGGTTVTAGTLQIGVGGTVGSLTGNVTNNGALVFNRSDAVSFNGDIDGTGSLTKTGAGTLTLTGANTYTGGTTISAGKLAVNGSLTNSAVTVNSGGTLGGSGNIGDTVTVNSGGTLAPGNSIGTSTVTGDFTLDSGATLEVELKSGGNTAGTHNDHVNVSGTATIADGAKLHVTPEATADKTTNPGYAANTQYTILTAGGGLTVNGAQVVADDYPYLNFTASHDSTRYYLTSALAAVPGPSPDPTPDPTPEPTPDLTPGPSIETFRLPGMSPNQGHVADAAFRLGAGNPLYDRLLNLTSGQVDSAFDSLFGTSHVFAASLAFSAACEFHDLLGQRLNGSGGAFDTAHFGGGNLSGVRFAYAGDRQASLFDSASGPEAREGFWMRALASKGRIDGDGNGPGADTSAAGLALGADREINPETRVGLAFAYTRSAADPRSAREDVEVTSYQLAAYGRWQGEAAYLNSSLSFGRHRTESRRDIVVMSERAEAAYDADSLSLSLETGRPLFYGPAVLTPYFGLEAAVVDREGFTEKGSNAALQVQGRRDESLRTRAGLRYQWQGARFQPTVDLAWVHEFGDRRSSLDAAFASAPAATRFATNGPELDRDRLAVGVGFTAWSGRLGGSNARVSVGYRGEFAGNGRDHSLGAEVRWVW